MKIFGKITSLLIAVSMMAGLATGCGQKTTASSSGTASSSSSEKFTLSYMTWEGDAMNKLIESALSDFKSAHPNITVLQIPSPISDYATKLQEMISANDAPDIFQSGNDWVIQYGAKGVLLDITSYCNADSEFMNGFYKGTTDFFKISGKQYGLPGLVNVYGYLYNKKLFDKAGIKYPTEDWTYDDLFTDAKALKKVCDYGAYGVVSDLFSMSLYSVANGGASFTDAAYPVTKVTADSKLIEGIEKYAACYKDGTFAPTTYSGDVTAEFIAGKIGLLQYGQWEVNTVLSSDDSKKLEWGYVRSPKGSASVNAGIYDLTGWAACATTKHPAETYQLLKYMVSTMYEKVLPDSPVAAASYQSANDAYFAALKKDGVSSAVDAIQDMMNVDTKLPVRFLQPWASDAANCYTNWDDIINGKSDAQTSMDKIVSGINSVISSES